MSAAWLFRQLSWFLPRPQASLTGLCAQLARTATAVLAGGGPQDSQTVRAGIHRLRNSGLLWFSGLARGAEKAICFPVRCILRTQPRNPRATECLTFSSLCTNACHFCQLPRLFDSLPAAVLLEGVKFLAMCKDAQPFRSEVGPEALAAHAGSVPASAGCITSCPTARATHVHTQLHCLCLQ